MTDWMDHLKYLKTVADEDVRCVEGKEATYKGSWKKSGGRSAWFMLRRKIDRMLEMLKKPEDVPGFDLADLNDILSRTIDPTGDIPVAFPVVKHLRDVYTSEDIFLKIEDDPSGDDGSVLAEIRDLRRYLLLVEAEMMSRRVIEYPSLAAPKGKGVPVTPPPQFGRPASSGPIASMDLSEAEKRIIATERAADPANWPEAYGPGTPEDGGHHARQGDPEFLQHSDEWKRG